MLIAVKSQNQFKRARVKLAPAFTDRLAIYKLEDGTIEIFANKFTKTLKTLCHTKLQKLRESQKIRIVTDTGNHEFIMSPLI